MKLNEMKNGFSSPLLWEYQYPKIEYSHNGAAVEIEKLKLYSFKKKAVI